MSEPTSEHIEIPGAFRPLMGALQERARRHALAAEMPPEQIGDYVAAISLYLALAIGKCVDYCSTLTTWNTANAGVRSAFPRQAVAMNWDYAEANPLLLLPRFIEAIADVLEQLPAGPQAGYVTQQMAQRVGERLDEVVGTLHVATGRKAAP